MQWFKTLEIYISIFLEGRKAGGFPGGPVVRTLPSSAEGVGLIPGGELRSHVHRGQKQNMEQKQYCHKFNEDFKNGPH